jgi:Holliday junction resolvase RusA-like endonuclease
MVARMKKKAPGSTTLTLLGHCPSKKNAWKRGKNGVYLDNKVSAQIEWLTLQAAEQWSGRALVEHPNMRLRFYVRDKRQDRDNLMVTVMDCLQKAGVIRNDNTARCNGTILLEPSVMDKDERVVIEVMT